MRQCRLNFADNRYDCEAGIIGEHYATELIVTPPAIMPTEAVYRLCFEPGGLSEIILQTTDGAFSYPLPSAVTATPHCCVTLIGYVGSEQIYKSRMVRLHFSQTADGDNSIDLQQPGIVDEVNRNTAARHTHSNKAVLDKFAETNGKPTYDGEALGGGSAGDITAEDVGYTPSEDIRNKFPELAELESDTVKSGLDVAMYYAFAGMFAKNIACDVPTATGTNTVELQSTLDGFVFPAMEKAHEHANKSVLDLISATDGKLQYNGSDVSITKNGVINALGYTPEAVSKQVTAGSNITLADNTEYRLTDVTTLTLTYPTGDFECWMRLNFAVSGDVTVTLPTGTKYIGTAPDFKNGETWEMSIKDGVVIAQKVGDGT